MWHSPQGNISGNPQDIYRYPCILDMSLKISNLRLELYVPGASELNSFARSPAHVRSILSTLEINVVILRCPCKFVFPVFACSLECEVLQHLLQAQLAMASCSFLHALLHLNEAHGKLAVWAALPPSREVGTWTLGSSSALQGGRYLNPGQLSHPPGRWVPEPWAALPPSREVGTWTLGSSPTLQGGEYLNPGRLCHPPGREVPEFWVALPPSRGVGTWTLGRSPTLQGGRYLNPRQLSHPPGG